MACIEGNKELKYITAKVTEEEKTLSMIETCQAQIDVLNKVKEHLFFGVSLGFLRLYVDELIKEVKE